MSDGHNGMKVRSVDPAAVENAILLIEGGIEHLKTRQADLEQVVAFLRDLKEHGGCAYHLENDGPVKQTVEDAKDDQPTDANPGPPAQEPRRRGRRKAAQGSARSSKRRYLVSQKDIRQVLEAAGEPLTVYKIRERLDADLNISVTEDKIKAALQLGNAFEETVDGVWTIA